MIKENRLINLFMELVQIDSPSCGERKMADRLKKDLRDLGAIVYEDNTGEKINGNTGNLIAEFKGNSQFPVLLLSAHMDRVEPGKNIRPKIKDDYIVSNGKTILGADDIIGVAAIIETLKIIKEKNINHGDIIIVFSVAEEIGLQGAKHLDKKILDKADYGVVLDVDGDVGTVVYKAPTQIKINSTIKGKAAHAGINPVDGVNAIKIASKAISEIKLGQIDEETTANIGVIKGGRAINIVPEIVKLEGEIRSHSKEKLLRQTNHMKQSLEAAANHFKGEISFEINRLYTKFELNKESDIIKTVAKSIKELNYDLIFLVSGGGSDANIFNEKGLETVNLGVGMEFVHSTQERVSIENMINTTKLLLKIITNCRDYQNV